MKWKKMTACRKYQLRTRQRLMSSSRSLATCSTLLILPTSRRCTRPTTVASCTPLHSVIILDKSTCLSKTKSQHRLSSNTTGFLLGQKSTVVSILSLILTNWRLSLISKSSLTLRMLYHQLMTGELKCLTPYLLLGIRSAMMLDK